MLIYTLGLRPLVGLLRYCNPHDNLCWNLTADDLAAYQYLNEVFVVLTWILTSAVFDKNWSVSNCESYVWNSGASKPMGEFVFIRFEFCSIFVNFLPLAMVMSFLNGAAEALVPKECLTCLGHGPGDATSKAWWLSFSPQPPGILEDIAAIADFQTQPRRIIHWKWKCSGGADVLHCVLRHSWQIHEAGNGLPTGAGFAELPLNGPDPEEWSENQGGKGIEIRNILQRSSIAKVNWESVGADNNTSSMLSKFWLG